MQQLEYKTIFRVLWSTAAFAGLIYLCFLLSRELIWVAAGLFLALALNPSVDSIKKYLPRQSRGLATAVVFSIFIAIISVLGATLVPPLVSQSQQLVDKFPGYAAQVQDENSWIGQLARNHDVAEKLRESQDDILGRVTGAGSSVVSVLGSVFNGFAAGFTILTVALFMLLEMPTWNKSFWQIVPKRRRGEYQKIAGQMYGAVSGYVNGNLVTSLIAAVVTAIMLTILGVPFAIPLGILVGILDLLPLVGATLAAILVVTVALFTSLTAAIVMGIFFVIYQQIENNILQPIVYGKTVQISPLVVTVSAILGASLAGIFGAIVAIPLAACIKILIDHYVEKND